jgi:16S rRNA (adenine1518-N6/adenine1519-N6)-dimethyltransferase
MVVKQAFSQRRKMLRNTLQPIISVADLTRLNIDASLRPEQITVAEYVKISNAVC